MSSCGSSGYFSSSPTLSSSPPVLCNPKSGEWSDYDLGDLGRYAGWVPWGLGSLRAGFPGKQILRLRETSMWGSYYRVSLGSRTVD